MREIVKLINKKDLEEIIDLELKLYSFYQKNYANAIHILNTALSFIFLGNKEIKEALGTNYIQNFSFLVSHTCLTLSTYFRSDNRTINIEKDIQLEKNFTSKDIAKHIEQIIDEYNKEQDYITFVWGDEE